MYNPSTPKLPSAVAAMLAAATMTFMTAAPEPENGLYGGDTRVAAEQTAPSGLCIDRPFVGCEPIRA